MVRKRIKRYVSLLTVVAFSCGQPLQAEEPIRLEIEIDSAPVEVQLPTPPAAPEEKSKPEVTEQPAPKPPAEQQPVVAETVPEEPRDAEKKDTLMSVGIGALVALILAAAAGGGGGGGGGVASTPSHR